ncbi:MAG TPA: hypothetical protein VIF09_25535 [Polyangiaceae bacterium]
MKPLVTPSSFHICSLMTVVPKGRQVGTDSMDAMTLPDPVSVDALRAALAEAAERQGLRKAPAARAALPIVVPHARGRGGKAPRRAVWTRVALGVGVFLLLASTRFAADRMTDAAQAAIPAQDVTTPATAVDAPQEPPEVVVAAPTVATPVVVTAPRDRPGATLARRAGGSPPASTTAVKRAPARTKDDDDLEAAARLQRLAAQQLGATLGR